VYNPNFFYRFNVRLSYRNFSEFEVSIYLLDPFRFIIAREGGDPRPSLLVFDGASALVPALGWVEWLPRAAPTAVF
jgi:hypothetical protein